MARLPALFILFLSVYGCYSFTLEYNDELLEGKIQWPTEYHLKGEELDLKSGLKTTFELWYSKNLDRYRRDYYGGVEKKYFYGSGDNENSTVYHLFPMSDENSVNEIMCVKESAEDTDFLISLSKVNYTGEEKFEDKTVQEWELVIESEDGDKIEVKAFTYKVGEDDVPLQITMKVYDLNKGSLKSHTITNYYDFSDEFDETDLDVEWEGAVCDDEDTFWKKYDHNNLDHNKKTHVDFAFKRFKAQHHKIYDDKEHEMRKAIFHENWKKVVEHNNKNLGYKLEMNKYADWTDEEFAVLSGLRPSTKDYGAIPFPHTDAEVEQIVQDLPEDYDLRLEGLITPVKNQGSCGSCWAFCTVAAIEGVLALKNGGRNLDLSEQSLVDCAWGFNNMGCNGGETNGGLKYALEHGVPTELEYGPYLEKDGLCEVYNMTKLYHIVGFGQVTPRNVNAMKVALVKYGPMVVGIHASDKMKLYSSGVFYDIECSGEQQNHGVTLVGYGVRDGDLYWIVKNSWGEDWGEDGYILISANNNNCLLMDTAFYPIA